MEVFQPINERIKGFNNVSWASPAEAKFFNLVKLVVCDKFEISFGKVCRFATVRRLPGLLAVGLKRRLDDVV